ncbi:hypothetical protein HOD29_05105 [archaeon]|jgi:hypothetical protein|nr:hypothetical protein [archaeon]
MDRLRSKRIKRAKDLIFQCIVQQICLLCINLERSKEVDELPINSESLRDVLIGMKLKEINSFLDEVNKESIQHTINLYKKMLKFPESSLIKPRFIRDRKKEVKFLEEMVRNAVSVINI